MEEPVGKCETPKSRKRKKEVLDKIIDNSGFEHNLMKVNENKYAKRCTNNHFIGIVNSQFNSIGIKEHNLLCNVS